MVTYKGMSFPFRISSATGGVEVASYTDDREFTLLRQSLIQIIGTAVGERVREKYFGTESFQTLFEPNDSIASGLLIQSIVKAVSSFEPRVTIRDVQTTNDEENGELAILISYVVNRTGQQDQFAFSF